MAIQTIFKRYELKYILTQWQQQRLCQVMDDYVERDEYGSYQIRNLYFDTADYRVIRHSLTKPIFKEKLRMRCYGEPSEADEAFLELKKKWDGVVYKRRIAAPAGAALDYAAHQAGALSDCQIQREIDYYRNRYPDLEPRVYLSYQREAYRGKVDGDFRMTFDSHILARNSHLSLKGHPADRPVLDDNQVVLEVKTTAGLPAWLLDFCREEGLYKTSFSKCGTAYTTYILPEILAHERSRLHA